MNSLSFLIEQNEVKKNLKKLKTHLKVVLKLKKKKGKKQF